MPRRWNRLSRRRFLAAAGAAAGAAALPLDRVAEELWAPLAVPDALTTLQATIVPQGSGGRYRKLGWGPGEPFLVREELGVRADPARVRTRRPLLAFAQVSDTHITDAQSPLRFDLANSIWQILALCGSGGTLSIFTVVLDHAAPPQTDGTGYTPQRLASIGRELSANEAWWRRKDTERGRGTTTDRNCELIIRTPPAITNITPQTVALTTITNRTLVCV